MASKYPNSGALSKNERKEQPNHPDFTGSIDVDGTEYWLSGWKKDGAKGPFISLSLKPKEAKPASSQPAKSQPDDPFAAFE